MHSEKIAERVAMSVLSGEKKGAYPDTAPTEPERKKWREDAEERRRKDGIRPRKGNSYSLLGRLHDAQSLVFKARYDVLNEEYTDFERKDIIRVCQDIIGQARETIHTCETK